MYVDWHHVHAAHICRLPPPSGTELYSRLLDFDDSTGANRAEGSPLSVGPVALLGVGLLLAAGVQGVIPH